MTPEFAMKITESVFGAPSGSSHVIYSNYYTVPVPATLFPWLLAMVTFLTLLPRIGVPSLSVFCSMKGR